MMATKLRIGVIFGGRSGEHAVSLMSARFILSQLDPEKFQVTQIGITRQGAWLTGEDALQSLIEGDISKLPQAAILGDPIHKGIYLLKKDQQLELLTELDVVFPVLHGTFGEDGTLQGLLEMADLAYVGAGVTGSAVGMDKAVFHDVMRANDIPVVPNVLLLRSEILADMPAAQQKAESVGDYPLFVKPANLGSSVGISKVKNPSDLIEGLMEAALYDRRVVVQKGLNVREIEVAVMGNDRPEASLCGEVLPGAEFYSYDAKYHDDRSRTIVPADLPHETSEHIRQLAIQAYLACDLAGLARVDFFIDKDDQQVYINELNTIPGFTQISMYPMLWAASGVPNQELVHRLIGFALERKAQRDDTKREFWRDE